jgi:uncharacterized membrane protein YhaH (DUF805 family)
MVGGRMARLRWRLRGAWLWPSFLALVIVDALVGHALPAAGSSQSLVGAGLIALFLMLIAIVALAPALGMLVRRVRGDMPRVVARDYGGTAAIVTVSTALLAAGLIHHSTVAADQATQSRALASARAYIRRHAPRQFATDTRNTDTHAIQPGSIYRVCALNLGDTRDWCVVVNTRYGTVKFAGYESNWLLFQGAD